MTVVLRLFWVALAFCVGLGCPCLMHGQSRNVSLQVERLLQCLAAPSLEVSYVVQEKFFANAPEEEMQQHRCRLLYVIDRRRRDTAVMLSVGGDVARVERYGKVYETGRQARTVIVAEGKWRQLTNPSYLPFPLLSMGQYVREHLRDSGAQVSVRDSVVGTRSIAVLEIVAPYDGGQIVEANYYRMLFLFDTVRRILVQYRRTLFGSGPERQEDIFTFDSVKVVTPVEARAIVDRELRGLKRGNRLLSMKQYMKDDEELPASSLRFGDTIPAELQRYVANALVSMKGPQPKVLLLDFSYVNCYPCRLAMPELDSLHMAYRDSGLVVLGVDPIDTDTMRVNGLLRKLKVRYPMILVPRKLATDMKINSYPTFLLVHAASHRLLWQASGAERGNVKSVLRETLVMTE